MTTVAIIPARGGSTRIPRKNIKPFYGHPIIAYSIQKALKSGLFDRVVVSTDDQEIAEVAVRYGAEVHLRPPAMALNHVGTQEVAREAIMGLSLDRSDCVCCIYATAPLMSIHDLARGLTILIQDPSVDFTFSVGTDPLHDAGQFYWGFAHSFLNRAPLISPRTRMIPVSSLRDCDINVPADWETAERLFERLPSDE